MARCAHDFEPAEPLDGAPPRVRCRACGRSMTRLAASLWLEGYAAGVELGDRAAMSAGVRSMPMRAVAGLVSVLAFAGAAAVAGLRPQATLPQPSPAGLDCCGACVDWAAQLNADVERGWSRCSGDIAFASRRPVREAIASAERAFGDYAGAMTDALACSQNQVPGCAQHMPARVLGARQRAWAAKALVEKRIYDARLDSTRPIPQPDRGLDAQRGP